MQQRGVLWREDADRYVLGPSAREEMEQLCLSSDARHLRLVHSAE
jgi:hypothetical protein